MNMIRHHDDRMQFDFDSVQLPAALEHNFASLLGEPPTLVSREGHEDRTIAFQNVR